MFVFIDIGGTHTRLSVVKTLDTIGDPVIFDTPADPQIAVDTIEHELRAQLKQSTEISHIVIGVPGIISMRQKLEKLPHLPKWEHFPLKRILEDRFTCTVHIENDAALVGLGEAVYGAGKRGNIVAYVTVSTGVGGARIVGKQIDVSTYTFEPGKMLMGEVTVESKISGTALKKKYHTDPKNIESRKVWNEEEKTFGEFLATLVAFWSPDTIVLGGAMMHDIRVSEVDKHMKKYVRYIPITPHVVRGALDQYGGLYGGLAYLRNILKLR